jgi:hypothetical protein
MSDKGKHMMRRKREFAHEDLKELEAKYSEQLKQLVSFEKPGIRWKIRLLKKLDGNVDKVIEHLKTKAGKREKEVPAASADEQKVLAAVTALGLDFKPARVLRVLRKFEGDAAKTIKRLQDKTARQKRNATPATSEEEVHLANLTKQGLKFNPVKCLHLLRKFEGDVKKVEERLKWKILFRSGRVEAKPEWEESLLKLENLGYTNPNKNIKLLYKFDGNFNQVVERLQKGREWRSKWLARRGEKAEKNVTSVAGSEMKDAVISNTQPTEIKASQDDKVTVQKEDKKKKKCCKREKHCDKDKPKLSKEDKLKRRAEKEAKKAERQAKKAQHKEEGKQSNLVEKDGKSIAAVTTTVTAVSKEATTKSVTDQSTASSGSDSEKWEMIHADKKDAVTKADYPVFTFTEYTSWPAQLTSVFLDGNNMLYVTGAIRRAALVRREVHLAENMLTELAVKFTEAVGSALSKCVLIYDNPNSQRKSQGTGLVEVRSARPTFSTSDDQLVAWAKTLKQDGVVSKPENALFVTSDRGLSQRLHAEGVTIMKPKEWFTFVASVLKDKQSGNVVTEHKDVKNSGTTVVDKTTLLLSAATTVNTTSVIATKPQVNTVETCDKVKIDQKEQDNKQNEQDKCQHKGRDKGHRCHGKGRGKGKLHKSDKSDGRPRADLDGFVAQFFGLNKTDK